MLISSSVLLNALKKYKAQKEKYSTGQSMAAGVNAGFTAFFLIVAVIFVALEILVLFYAILMALSCTQGGPERIIHVVLAIVFTLPYALISVFFSPCAKNMLRRSSPRSGFNSCRAI